MRITSGRFRNRRLEVPELNVRPASDRVREAVFSMLGDWIKDRHVLDLYAGTGSYGLEAMSRGAKSVVFVEADARVAGSLKENAARCGLAPGEAGVVTQSAEQYIETAPAERIFDLVFADPPYANSQDGLLLQNTLQALKSASMVQPDGFLVFEQQKKTEARDSEGWDLIRDRAYGKSRILLYRRKG
jgi:16S rRNA (guanine966-N2)-methyltransferase